MTERDKPRIGIIGGSGLYNIEGLTDVRWVRESTPFGDPSDEVCLGRLGGAHVAFLPRHGRGHRIPPSKLNYRANILALKQLGVDTVISVSAVGSLREDLPPGTFVIVDQFIDRTFAREKSFFDTGLVAHVSVAEPVCESLSDTLEAAAKEAAIPVVRGGTYLAMEGPQFSTKAESKLYRQWGCDVIGMTNMPEAKLAREAELCYASVAMVTDYDCWHASHGHVSVEMVIKVLIANAEKAKALIRAAVPRLSAEGGEPCSFGCHHALNDAIVTPEGQRDAGMIEKLWVVAGRVLQSNTAE